jgi:hypothetical protein
MSYSPSLGRWMQQDPLGYAAGDSNLYRYVGNEPVNITDPIGLEEKQKIKEEDVINLVKQLGSLKFSERQEAMAGVHKLLGTPPNLDVVKILELNKVVQELRKDPHIDRLTNQLLCQVPYRKDRLFVFVQELGSDNPRVASDAEKELGMYLRMFGEVGDLVTKVLENDAGIKELRKKAEINKKVQELIRFKGIKDEIPRRKDMGLQDRSHLGRVETGSGVIPQAEWTEFGDRGWPIPILRGIQKALRRALWHRRERCVRLAAEQRGQAACGRPRPRRPGQLVRVNVAGAAAARGRVVFGNGRASVVVVSFSFSSFVRFWASLFPEKLRKIDAGFVRIGRCRTIDRQQTDGGQEQCRASPLSAGERACAQICAHAASDS